VTNNIASDATVSEETLSSNSIELLRFTTAGSVDDGKSTLIGRLLVDSQGLYEDQLDAARKIQSDRGGEGVDLASITDGLHAEQEQGITIDVAYRYFSTPRRKFIIADTPGHEQYTRNMVTGASTADATIILIDARIGVRPQSRRHIYLAHLLGIKHIIVAVNKMDLVGYDEKVFNAIKEEFGGFCRDLGVVDLRFIPVSALQGDMIAHRGDKFDWYHGETLLTTLETLVVHQRSQDSVLRFPVQLVNRPRQPEYHDFRGYMGRVESGIVNVGDEVIVLPGCHKTKVTEIISFDGPMQSAHAKQSVTLVLEDEIDISRGDMIVGTVNQPRIEKEIDAYLCWMSEEPMQAGAKYLIRHAARTVKGQIKQLDYTVDINTLKHDQTPDSLGLNGIGRVKIRMQQPLVVDDYDNVRETGGFIVIDTHSNNTVAAGMITQ